MNSFYLTKGLIIRMEGREWELIQTTADDCYFEALLTGEPRRLGIEDFFAAKDCGGLEIVPSFSSENEISFLPKSPLVDISQLPARLQKKSARKLALVAAVHGAGISRGQRQHIKSWLEQARMAGRFDFKLPGVTTICNWLRDYEVQGNATPSFLGLVKVERKTRIDLDSERQANEVIREEYLNLKAPSVADCHKTYKTRVLVYNRQRVRQGLPPIRLMSLSTFQRRVRSIGFFEKTAARKGRQQAIHDTRMIRGHRTNVAPLEVAEIDHSPLNIFVLDDELWMPLGRPHLTAIRDSASGVVLGIYISFNHGGLRAIFACIKHSLRAHTYVAKRWGDLMLNPWPSFGLATKYVMDRGIDFVAHPLALALQQIGSDFEANAVRSPWGKPSIERFFHTLDQSLFESIPGKTFGSLADRGDYNPEKDAVIRFSTLVYLIHKWAVDFHNIKPNSRSLISPLDQWNTLIGDCPPPYVAELEQIDALFGIPLEGTLSQEGLRFRYLTYSDPDGRLGELRRRCEKIRLQFKANPDNLGQIFVVDPETHTMFAVPCTRPDYAEGLTLFQHDYLRKVCRERLNHHNAADLLMEARASLTQTIREEAAQKQKVRQREQRSRFSNLNSQSVLEGATQTIWGSPDAASFATKPVVGEVDEPLFTSAAPMSWGAL